LNLILRSTGRQLRKVQLRWKWNTSVEIVCGDETSFADAHGDSFRLDHTPCVSVRNGVGEKGALCQFGAFQIEGEGFEGGQSFLRRHVHVLTRFAHFPSTFAGGLVEGIAVREGAVTSDSGTHETLPSVTFLREFRTSGGVVGAGLAPVEEGEGG
jgi:hypothetical protein